MAAYVALYRKYRPGSFAELVGQEAIAKTLSSAIAQQRLAHAYLFCGPRGTGKTSVARILAKSLNCAQGPTDKPCGVCPSCVDIVAGRNLDVVEIDAASNNGVDNIRDLQDRVALAPVGGRYKVYIIDEVHMLSQGAFNALLKTLEEPPPNVVFVLATTDAHRVLPTIISRCQRFDFGRIPLGPLVERLAFVAEAEGIQVDRAGLTAIARRAQGGLRDALSLLDQTAAMAAGGPVSADEVAASLGLLAGDRLVALGAALIGGEAATALDVASALVAGGHEPTTVVRELMGHFRHLLVLQMAPQRADALEVPVLEREALLAQAQAVPAAELGWILEVLDQTEQTLRRSPQQAIWLEMGLIKLARRPAIPSLLELSERLAALEAAVGGGKPLPAAPAPRAAARPPVEQRPAAPPAEQRQAPPTVAEEPPSTVVEFVPRQTPAASAPTAPGETVAFPPRPAREEQETRVPRAPEPAYDDWVPPSDDDAPPPYDDGARPSDDERPLPPGSRPAARPAADLGARPSADLGARPPVDLGARPPADPGARPSADFAAKPPADFGASPPVDLGARPPVDFGARPPVDLGAKPPVEAQPRPAASAPTPTPSSLPPAYGGERPIPPGAWERTREQVRARNRPTAALLDPPAAVIRWEADGAVVIKLPRALKDIFERQPAKKKILLEEIARCFGQGAFPRLEAGESTKPPTSRETQQPAAPPASSFAYTPPAAQPAYTPPPAPPPADGPPMDEEPPAWLDDYESSRPPDHDPGPAVTALPPAAKPKPAAQPAGETDGAVKLAMDLFNGRLIRRPGIALS